MMLGKTVTTELAGMEPGADAKPGRSRHTPGGSSAGSAAAVAAGQVPLAIGTQTGRLGDPAGRLLRHRRLQAELRRDPAHRDPAQSPSLDTVGVFARSVPDAAVLADVLFGYDSRDRATTAAAPPRLLELANSRVPVPPVFAFVRLPGWEEAAPETRLALAELVDLLGEQAFEAELPAAFDEAAAVRERINLAEMAKCYHGYERRGRDRLSDGMREAIDAGKAIPARDYIAALDWPDLLYAALEAILARCDAILAPAAPGPAPEGLASTGSPIFNGLWTLCGVPAVTLPLLEAANGLPMGVQLIGRRCDDGRLLEHGELAYGAGRRSRSPGRCQMIDKLLRSCPSGCWPSFSASWSESPPVRSRRGGGHHAFLRRL